MSVKRYLRSFNDHSDYEEYMDSSDLVMPNVSYCRQENEVHYNSKFVIEFASDWVKEQLLTLGIDQNEDGEIDTYEAALYSGNFGNLFNYNTSGKPETSFNEFRFFTGMTSVYELTFAGWSELTSVMIPNSVTYIGTSAFSFCTGLTSITIPDSVTSIGSGAFYNCTGLTSITIPEGVTSISSNAFQNCSGLTSITIPDSVTSIEYGAFNGCTSLPVENYIRYADTYLIGATDKTRTTYQIKDGTKFIGSSAFYNCTSLTSIVIPDSVTSIGGSAFQGCSGLTSITIPDSVTSIEYGAFSDCTGLPVENYIRYADTYLIEATDKARTTYQIKDGTKSIGGYAFNQCLGLTNVTIPSTVTSIGQYAFRNCSSLTSVTIGNGVTSIEQNAFNNCPDLTNITIPNSVTSIGYNAFNNCIGLTSVTVLAETPPTLGSSAFANNASGRKIYVPAGSVNTYKAATNWSTYASDIEAIPTA